MLLRLQNGISSMKQMMREQERVANNLANANTVGFKRDRTFTEVFDEFLDDELAPRSVREMTQWADMAQGAVVETGNPLDIALEGEGLLVLSDEASGTTRYVRSGHFELDAEGTLRDPKGFVVEGEGGPIEIPENAGPIEIDKTGEVRVGNQVFGQLRVVTFDDPFQLERLDGATFDAGDLEPIPVEDPAVLQGYVESSNVDVIREMTDMIDNYRQFESQQKMLHTTDALLGRITRDLGRF